MDDFHNYLLSITVAAIVCCLIKNLLGEKNHCTPLIRILCGIFMAYTLIRPVLHLDFSSVTSFTGSFSSEAEAAAHIGEEAATDELTAVIKAKTESYILDKAAAMEVDLNVEITLDSFIPTAVVLRGAVSPYARSTLTAWITQQLGIPKEAQVWIG